MKCKVDRAEARRVVDKVRRAGETRTTIPVLAHVKLTAEGERLHLIATDLDVSLRWTMAAEVVEPGEATANGLQLWRALGASAAEVVELRAADGKLSVGDGATTVTLRSMDVADYPSVPELEEAKVEPVAGLPVAALRGLAAVVLPAMTSDAGRFQLNSARLECKGDAVRLHGTDGHRMAQAKVAAATGHGELLVPRQAVKMLATLPAGGDAEIATVPHHGVDGNVYRRGVVDAGPWRLAFRIGEATFPDCDKVAGGLEPTSRAHVDRETLERVVRRAKELSGLRLQALRLTGEAGNAVLHVEAENVADLTLVRSDLAADLLGAPPRVAAQAAYVLDFLRVCRARKVERIAVESAGPETLTRWLALGEEDGTEWAHYIMPMRDEKL